MKENSKKFLDELLERYRLKEGPLPIHACLSCHIPSRWDPRESVKFGYDAEFHPAGEFAFLAVKHEIDLNALTLAMLKFNNTLSVNPHLRRDHSPGYWLLVEIDDSCIVISDIAEALELL